MYGSTIFVSLLDSETIHVFPEGVQEWSSNLSGPQTDAETVRTVSVEWSSPSQSFSEPGFSICCVINLIVKE